MPFKYTTTKPPLPCSINWGHPLADGLIACFLINEFTGNQLVDLVSQAKVPFNGSPTWTSTQFGIGLDCSAANDTGAQVAASSLPKLTATTTTRTILWRGIIKASPSLNAPLLYISFDSNPNTSPFTAFALATGGSANTVASSWNSGGFVNSLTTATLAAFDSSERDYVAVIQQSRQNIYENGALATSVSAGNTGWTFGASPQLCIGQASGLARNSNSIIRHGFIWLRELSPTEVFQMHAEPYSFIQASRKITYVTLTAAAPATIKVARRTNAISGTKAGSRQMIRTF